MIALMYQKPDDHIKFLEECLERVKIEEKVRWHTFIDPLPDIPKTHARIKSESDRSSNTANEITLYHSRDFVKNEMPLPPIGAYTKTDVSNYVAESQNDANTLTEKVFNSHIMSEVKTNEDLWYSKYTERKIDTSCLEGKPVIFVLGMFIVLVFSRCSFTKDCDTVTHVKSAFGIQSISKGSLQSTTFLKKGLQHSCFPVNFAKVSRKDFFETSPGDCFCIVLLFLHCFALQSYSQEQFLKI